MQAVGIWMRMKQAMVIWRYKNSDSKFHSRFLPHPWYFQGLIFSRFLRLVFHCTPLRTGSWCLEAQEASSLYVGVQDRSSGNQ